MNLGAWSKKQKEFIRIPYEKHKRIVLCSGSVRSGKTVANIPKALQMFFYAFNNGNYPTVIMGKTKETIYRNVLKDLFSFIGEKNYRYNQATGQLKIKYGKHYHTSYVIGADNQNAETKIRGLTVAGAYVDELTTIPYNVFVQLLNRMSVNNSKLFATTNPDSQFHWLYQDFIEPFKGNSRSDFELYEFYLDDNIHLSEEYKEFIKNAYAGLLHERFILGKWKVAEGLVHKHFGEANKRKKINYDPELKLYISCDFNYDPMCWVLLHREPHQIIKDGKIVNTEWYKVYQFDEIVASEITVGETVDIFAAKYTNKDQEIIINGDASGWYHKDGHNSKYAQLENRLHELGYNNVKLDVSTYNPIESNLVASVDWHIRRPDGRVSYYVSEENCKYTIMNLETLQYKKGTNNIYEPSSSQIKSNEQLKYVKHIWDALAYHMEYYHPILERSGKYTDNQGAYN